MKIFHRYHHLKSKRLKFYFKKNYLYIFSTQSHRPTSPKSDTEYELDKPSEQSIKNNRTSIGWRWRWGELPEQGNFFRYLWPSSAKQSTPKEGLYLDDITNNKCDDRSLYLPQM